MSKDVTIKIGARDTASSVLNKITGNTKKFASSVAASSKRAAASMQAFGSSLTSVGKRMTLFGAAGVAAFAGMTRTFASFDDSMAKVSAISGAVGNDLESLRDKAKELGSSTKFSASEAAEGMKFLGMAGFNTNQILAGIGPTLALAAAGGVELAEAADIASDVGSAFGLTADELSRVADVIAATATSANTDVLMMGETFKKLAPIAKAAGQSIEETSAAAGILGNSGVKASEAGTDLKNILAQLSTAPVQKAMDKLGVKVKDAHGEFLPMLDIMADFNAKTSKLTGPEKLGKAVELFGKRSAKSALILGDAGDSIDVMRDKMLNAEGAAQRMADTMQTGLGGTFVKLRSAFEGFQIAVIEQIAGSLNQAVDAVTKFIAKVTEWISKNQMFVKIAAASAIAITAIGGALVATGVTLGVFGAALAGIVAGFSALSAFVGAIFTPIGIAVGIATIALVAFSVEIYNTIKGTTELVTAGKILMKGFSNIKETVVNAFGGISDALQAGEWKLAAEIAWSGIKVAFWQGLDATYAAVKQVLPLMWDAFKTFFSKAISGTWKSMKLIGEIIAKPWKAIDLAKQLGEAMSGGGEFAGEGISGMIAKQVDDSKAKLDELIEKAKDAGDLSRSKNAAGKTGTEIGSTIGGAVAGALKNGVDFQGMLTGAAGALDSIPDKLASLMPDDWMKMEQAKKAASELGTMIKKSVPNNWMGIVEQLKDGHIETTIGDIANKVGQALGAGAIKATDAAVDAATAVGKAIKIEKEPAKELASLQATQGRLLSRNPSSDPVLSESKKQTNHLKQIATNTVKQPPDPKKQSQEVVIVG